MPYLQFIQNYPKISKNIQNYPKLSKIIQNYPNNIFWINTTIQANIVCAVLIYYIPCFT